MATQMNSVLDLGEDLQLRIRRRPSGFAGTWVSGSLHGYVFDALVFPAHAEQTDYELFGNSQISKLWLRRISDRVTVFNWDRGEDVPAADAEVAAVVEFLAEGLAESVFGYRAERIR